VGLTLTAPRNLVWAGGNPDPSWDYVEPNFTLADSPVTFLDGDDVTFNDASGNSFVTISNNVIPTLVSVAGTASYTFGGPNEISGVAQLVDSRGITGSPSNRNQCRNNVVRY